MKKSVIISVAGLILMLLAGGILTVEWWWPKSFNDLVTYAEGYMHEVTTDGEKLYSSGRVRRQADTTIAGEVNRGREVTLAAREEAKRREAEEAARAAAAATSITVASMDLPTYATLQEAVDGWLNTYQHGAVGLEIFDLNRGGVVASYNSYAQMGPRSIYKLFYTYDAYTQIDAGLDDPNAPYFNNYTLGYCLDIMIRVSNNPCAETMLGDEARLARVGQMIQNLGLTGTRADALKTTAHDVVTLLRRYYAHPEWSESSWQKFRDAAINQGYTYRKGLPSGFSTATVLNKTGFGGADYNDAAILEFPNGQRYAIAVLTTGTPYRNIAILGGMIEKTILANN